MSDQSLRLRVLTPTHTVLDREVDFVLLRTKEGDMGVLHGHEPSAVLLDIGVLRAYVDKEQTELLAVMGGFATVRDNRVTVLSDIAEPPDKIEAAIARRERDRAENQKREQGADLEMRRAESALRRTLVQMDISSYSIIKGKEEKDE